MIPITPDIMGPGIEEEYADALRAITEIRHGLAPVKLTNDTPDGRLLLNIGWVEQEIRAGRLPIPVDRSFVETIHYLVGSGEVDHLASNRGEVAAPLAHLSRILNGTGLMKPRHLPVLISMMQDLVDDARRCPPTLTDAERATLADLAACLDYLRNGGAWPINRRPQDYFRNSSSLAACIDNFGNRLRSVKVSLFAGWRPGPAQKPPLQAPIPGLPPRAAPLPPELANRLP